MYRISAGLAACLAAAALAGCATAPAAGKPSQTPLPPAATAGTPAACLRTSTITLAGNGKTYCFRVGQKLDVLLRGTLARALWQEPRVRRGNVLVGVPNGALSLIEGLHPAPRTPPSGPGARCSPRSGPRARVAGPARQITASARSSSSCAYAAKLRAWADAPARPSGAARAERTVVEMDNQAETTRATEGA